MVQVRDQVGSITMNLVRTDNRLSESFSNRRTPLKQIRQRISGMSDGELLRIGTVTRTKLQEPTNSACEFAFRLWK
jgi:hypothetical protein